MRNATGSTPPCLLSVSCCAVLAFSTDGVSFVTDVFALALLVEPEGYTDRTYSQTF